MVFAAVGVATALLYVAWVVWAPLLPGNLYIPLLDLGKITGYTWRAALEYLFIVVSLYVLYVVGYCLVVRGGASVLAIFAIGVLLCIVVLGAYPATAVDVFGYIAHGRLMAVHQANPFVVPPDAYPSDPILPYLAFPSEPSQYGPLWVLLGDALATIARGDLMVEVLLYKAVAALAHLVGALLVLVVGRRLGAEETHARAGAFLFLWNPLLLWEMVGNAHNDGLMMVGGLLAVWLLLRGNALLVLPALMFGALIKVPVIVVAPLMFVAVWRHSRLAAVEGFWLALALAAVVYRPFWEGLDTLTALRRTDLFTASLGSVLRLLLEPSLGLALASNVARWVSLGAFGAVVVITLWRALHVRGPREIVTLGYFTLLAAALLATTWFQAWYLVWPFAFGAAVANWRRHLEMALLSLGGLLQYFVFIYLWVIGVFPPEVSLPVQGAAYLSIIGPLVLGVVAARYARRTTHREETVGAN